MSAHRKNRTSKAEIKKYMQKPNAITVPQVKKIVGDGLRDNIVGGEMSVNDKEDIKDYINVLIIGTISDHSNVAGFSLDTTCSIYDKRHHTLSFGLELWFKPAKTSDKGTPIVGSIKL